MEREEVNPESWDRFGRTPLSHAARYGREGVVKLLLEREEVDPQSRSNCDRTLRSYAAKYGREGELKLLTEWDEPYLLSYIRVLVL